MFIQFFNSIQLKLNKIKLGLIGYYHSPKEEPIDKQYIALPGPKFKDGSYLHIFVHGQRSHYVYGFNTFQDFLRAEGS